MRGWFSLINSCLRKFPTRETHFIMPHQWRSSDLRKQAAHSEINVWWCLNCRQTTQKNYTPMSCSTSVKNLAPILKLETGLPQEWSQILYEIRTGEYQTLDPCNFWHKRKPIYKSWHFHGTQKHMCSNDKRCMSNLCLAAYSYTQTKQETLSECFAKVL